MKTPAAVTLQFHIELPLCSIAIQQFIMDRMILKCLQRFGYLRHQNVITEFRGRAGFLYEYYMSNAPPHRKSTPRVWVIYELLLGWF